VRLTPSNLSPQSLVANPNVSIPHAKILQTVWARLRSEVEYLHVLVNQLRRRLSLTFQAAISSPNHVGYRFQLPPEAIAFSLYQNSRFLTFSAHTYEHQHFRNNLGTSGLYRGYVSFLCAADAMRLLGSTDGCISRTMSFMESV